MSTPAAGIYRGSIMVPCLSLFPLSVHVWRVGQRISGSQVSSRCHQSPWKGIPANFCRCCCKNQRPPAGMWQQQTRRLPPTCGLWTARQCVQKQRHFLWLAMNTEIQISVPCRHHFVQRSLWITCYSTTDKVLRSKLQEVQMRRTTR